MKFCKDCKYHEPQKFGGPLCMHPHFAQDLNPVTGQSIPNYCEVLRLSVSPTACTINALGFQPKETVTA